MEPIGFNFCICAPKFLKRSKNTFFRVLVRWKNVPVMPEIFYFYFKTLQLACFFLPRFWDMIFWSIGENYAEPNLRHFEEFRCLENNNACMQYSFWMWMFDDILAEGRIVSIKMIRSRNCGTTQDRFRCSVSCNHFHACFFFKSSAVLAHTAGQPA